MLGQAVGNLVPGRFGIHEDVHGWTDARIVQQRTHCDVHVFTAPHDRIDQGSAISAVHVVSRLLVAVDQQPVAAAAQADIRATDTRQGFEGGARRSTALRTVAVQRIFELAPHRILNGPAKTLTARLLWHDVTLRVRLMSAMGGVRTSAAHECSRSDCINPERSSVAQKCIRDLLCCRCRPSFGRLGAWSPIQ
jgi:hypothetical protein